MTSSAATSRTSALRRSSVLADSLSAAFIDPKRLPAKSVGPAGKPPVRKNRLALYPARLENGEGAAGMRAVWLGVRQFLRSMWERFGESAMFRYGSGSRRTYNQSLRTGNNGDVTDGPDPA